MRSRRRQVSNESVDLGLSSILKNKGGAEVSVSPSMPNAAPITPTESLSIFTLDEDVVVAESTKVDAGGAEAQVHTPRSPHSILADGGNWSELSALTERELKSGDGSLSEARLWWVLSQFHLESMPLSVLAAPLEEGTRDIATSNTVSPELRALAARVLLAIGQRIVEIGGDGGDRLLARSRALHVGEGGEESRFEVKSFDDSSDTILPLSVVHAVTPSRMRTYVYGTGVIVALLFLWTMFPRLHQTGPDTLIMSGGESELMRSSPLLEVPLPSPLTSVGHLEALYYDVNREVSPGAAPQPAPVQPVKVVAPESAPPAAQPVAVQAPPQGKRDVVNTSYPVESREIEAAIQGGERRGIDRKRDDSRDDINWDGSFESHDEFSDRDHERERDRERERSRPRESDRSRHHDSGFDNDFGKGDRYEVVINTSVMERPSFNAAEVASLYSGDIVLVESRLGRWLKIESVKGVPGYIRAQDAEKLSGD